MIEAKENCCGCVACMYVCPKECISIKVDRIGNFYRVIDKNKCVSCGRCSRVCPTENVSNYNDCQSAYIAYNPSKAVVRKSASGGIAATIYRYCLNRNIDCVGVHYTKSLRAEYDFIKDIAQIDEFVSSKYVHSYMGKIYEKMQKKLKLGRKVVFIGLPCHVAAVKNIFGCDNPNLICIDLVCHGVVPERYLREHITRIKNIDKKKIKIINFREPDNQYGLSLRDEKGKLLYQTKRSEDEYMMGFCHEITYQESCYICPYATQKRSSDITLKDFAKCDKKYWKQMPYGISNVLINTKKGEDFFKQISNELYISEYPVQNVIEEDKRLQGNFHNKNSKKRRLFLKCYPVLGFDWAIRVLFCKQYLKNLKDKREGN